MAILPMLRLHIVGHKSEEEDVLEVLQELGALEVERINLENSIPLDFLPSKLSDLSKELSRIKTDINFLKGYVNTGGSIIDLFVPQKLSLSDDERDKSIREFNDNKGYETIEAWQSSLEEIKTSINNLMQDRELLHPFESLNFSIRDIKGFKLTDVFFCQMRNADFQKFTEEIEALPAVVSRVLQLPQYTFFIVASHREVAGEIRGIFSRYNVTTFNLDKFYGIPREELSRINSRIEGLKRKEEEILREIGKNGDKLLKSLYVIYDIYQNDYTRYEHLNKVVHTDSMFLITGWIREKDKKTVEETLERGFKDLYLVTAKPEPDEEPPIALENNSFVSPFEVVTGIYGFPNSREFDPTPFLAPFFVIFFGLCLTDAAYGVILSILSVYLYRNISIEKHRKKLLQLLFICGLFTIIAGAITGGWFGNISEAFSFLSFLEPIRKKLILFDPLKDPITFLVISLVLGFIQIIVGLFIKMILNVKRGQYKEAIFDQLFWILFLLSLVFTAGTLILEPLKPVSTFSTYFTIVMTIALIATQGRHQKSIFLKITSGLGSLYSVISYLSDVLSYSRLLALGLATGVIATVVNELVKTFSGIPVLGVILGVVIFIGGHIFNLVINAFGAFVHSSRLQFVEFFGKFFEGGGREFNPLKKTGTYTIEKEVTE